MHIAIGVLTILGFIAYFIMHVNTIRRGGRELVDAASDVKGLVRRRRFRRQTQVDPISQVEDPRLAAAAMMCALARCDGDITERQRDVILAQMASAFHVDQQEAEDLFSQGRWLSGEVKDLNAFLRRATGAVQGCCTEAEKHDLIKMLAQVTTVEGETNDHQSDAIRYLGERLGLEGGRPSPA